MVNDAIVVCLALSVPLIGVVSVVLARLAQRRGGHSLFLAGLVLVGLATVPAIQAGNGLALVCGSTLSLMAIGATLDLRGSATAPPVHHFP
jgi:hypothetical protein